MEDNDSAGIQEEDKFYKVNLEEKRQGKINNMGMVLVVAVLFGLAGLAILISIYNNFIVKNENDKDVDFSVPTITSIFPSERVSPTITSIFPSERVFPTPEIKIQKAEYKGYKIIQTVDNDFETSDPINILNPSDKLVNSIDYKLPLSEIISIGDYIYLISDDFANINPLYRIRFPFENSELEEVYTQDRGAYFSEVVKFSNQYWIKAGYGETCGGSYEYIEYDPLTNKKGTRFNSSFGCESRGGEIMGVWGDKFLYIDKENMFDEGLNDFVDQYKQLYLEDYSGKNKQILLTQNQFPPNAIWSTYDPFNNIIIFTTLDGTLNSFDPTTREMKQIFQKSADEYFRPWSVGYNKETGLVCLQVWRKSVSEKNISDELDVYLIDISGKEPPQKNIIDECDYHTEEEWFGFQKVSDEVIMINRGDI